MRIRIETEQHSKIWKITNDMQMNLGCEGLET